MSTLHQMLCVHGKQGCIHLLLSYVPRCWVGKRHLDIALDQVKKEYQVHIHWHPFVLNPWVPDHGMSFEEYATTKFGEDGLTRFISGQVPFFEKGKAVVRNIITS